MRLLLEINKRNLICPTAGFTPMTAEQQRPWAWSPARGASRTPQCTRGRDKGTLRLRWVGRDEQNPEPPCLFPKAQAFPPPTLAPTCPRLPSSDVKHLHTS